MATAGGRRGAASLVVALTVLAAALRFPTLDLQSFWFDEAVTAVDTLKPGFGDTLTSVRDMEVSPPLYFCLAWAWSQLFGLGESGLRSLSALVGTLTVPVAYAAAVQVVPRRGALAVAALACVSPLLVWYSQEARPYALFVLLAGLSLAFFLRSLRAPGRAPLILWALASTLAMATHYFAGFLVFPEAAWLLAAGPARRPAAAAVAAVVAAQAALVPLAVHQADRGGTDWIAARPLRERIADVPGTFVAGPSEPRSGWTVVLVGATALLLALCLAAWMRDPRADRGASRAALPALVVGTATLLCPLALALAGFDYFFARYLLPAWLPLLIGVAAWMAPQPKGARGTIAVAAICAALAGVNLAVALTPRLQREDWRAATRALGPPAHARVVVISPDFAGEPLRFYGQTLLGIPAGGVRVREIVVVGVLPPGPPPRPASRFDPVERRDMERLGLVRYRAPRPRLVTPAGIASALGRSPTGILFQRPEAPTRSSAQSSPQASRQGPAETTRAPRRPR